MDSVVLWQCRKCTKNNSYASSTDSSPGLLLEWKVMPVAGPRKKTVLVRCHHCGEKQTIEVDDD
jgi:hypothetical protein